jgi:hypothetical protein
MNITSQPGTMTAQRIYRLQPDGAGQTPPTQSAPQHHVTQSHQRYGVTLIELLIAIPAIAIPLGWGTRWVMGRRHQHNLDRLLTTGHRGDFWRAPKDAVVFRQGLERRQHQVSRATDMVGVVGGAGVGLGASKLAVQHAGIENPTTEVLIHGGSVVAGGTAGFTLAQLAKPKVLAKMQKMALDRFKRP